MSIVDILICVIFKISFKRVYIYTRLEKDPRCKLAVQWNTGLAETGDYVVQRELCPVFVIHLEVRLAALCWRRICI